MSLAEAVKRVNSAYELVHPSRRRELDAGIDGLLIRRWHQLDKNDPAAIRRWEQHAHGLLAPLARKARAGRG